MNMPNLVQSFLSLGAIIILQIIIYIVFLKPFVDSWGATKAETNMSLPGDERAPFIISTRAISIKAPMSDVWQWIIHIGADRGGFFSYTFIEKLLGYEARTAEPIPEFQDMTVGRVIPASIDESKSLIKYDFRVVDVAPGESFVIENWGTFALQKIDAQQTRLIVRTHGQEAAGLKSKLEDFLGMTAHYIMERRMMLGFKAQAEAGAGVHLSAMPDNLWLLGIFLSALGILAMTFLNVGLVTFFLAFIYSTLWLLTFMIFPPKPVFSLSLLLFISMILVW